MKNARHPRLATAMAPAHRNKSLGELRPLEPNSSSSMIPSNITRSSSNHYLSAAPAAESSPRRALLSRRFAGLGLALLLGTSGALSPQQAQAGGTWVGITHAPPGGLDNALLMTDGSILCGDGGSTWRKYTPDSSGNYANGTWTTVASTTYTRRFFSSQVLNNGNLYVAGGEYGTGQNFAELYNFTANSWSVISQPGGAHYSDAVSITLPNGNVLQGSTSSTCYLYSLSGNTISSAPSARGNQNEASWLRLPNDNILTIDAFGQNSEHYVPSQNAWFADGTTPTDLYGFGGELGSSHVLPNGKAFYLGATSNTAIYTPGSSLTAAGSWVSGATIPNSLGAVDAPACTMNNGKILCALGTTSGFGSTTNFYEYDYAANSFTLVNSPTGGTSYSNAPFASTMLQLPDGGVFFIGGQGSTHCYVYRPDGSPLAAGKPVVRSIIKNSNGSYHLTGVGLNGISAGAAYGDDFQMASNYPIVRLTNSSGTVYFARTFNWSSSAIQNPNAVTTEFTLPSGLPSGAYSLAVIANGNASDDVNFNTAGTAGSGFFEAEALAINSSTDTVDVVADSNYSAGVANILRSNGAGDSVVYLVPNISSGTYTVSVGMKKNTSRGQFQLAASRADQNTYTNIGGVIDEYENTTGDYVEVTAGSWTPGTTNDKLFRFSVTGKNAGSDQYWLSIDYIHLTKQ